MKITIDAEFKSLIPPQTPEESAALEQSILSEGCRDPLIVCNGTLIDGHHREEICTRLGIPYQTENRDFADRDEAIRWIITNQLSRRNLTSQQKSLLRGQHYNRIKKPANDGGAGKPKVTVDQNEPRLSAAETLAKVYGVSASTIKRDGIKAEGRDEPPKVSKAKHLSAHEGFGEKSVIDQKDETIAELHSQIKALTKRIEELERELSVYRLEDDDLDLTGTIFKVKS